MNRRNWILLIVLLVQAAFVAFPWYPRPSVAQAGPLLAGVTVDDVTGITLEGADKSIALARTAGGWGLSDADNYPANEINVSEVISKLAALNMGRPVATNASSHDRLQVAADNFVDKITLTTDDGKTHLLYLGSSPGARSIHARLDGDNTVYLESGLSSADVRPDFSKWIEVAYFHNSIEDAQRLTLENAAGVFDLDRDESGIWTLPDLKPGESVNQTEAGKIASRAVLINMSHPLGKEIKPEYSFDAPLATLTVALTPTVTITNAAGEQVSTYQVVIGAHNPDDNTNAVRSDLSEYVVAVPNTSLTSLISDTLASLVVAPVITDTAPITTTTVPTTFAPLNP